MNAYNVRDPDDMFGQKTDALEVQVGGGRAPLAAEHDRDKARRYQRGRNHDD